MLSIFTSINRAIQHARFDVENERLRRAQEYRLPNLSKGVGQAVLQRRERKRRTARKLTKAEQLEDSASTTQAATEDYEEDSMAGRYIPPHLRNKGNVKSASDVSINPGDELYSLNEIISHFGQVVGKHSTLNASASNPNTLAFILVFSNQHPNHDSHGEILCKSNLHLLPTPADTTSIDASTTIPAPKETIIPIFEQHGRLSHNTSFKSLGWHSITGTTYLEPRSAALVSKLDEKFKIKKADGTQVQKTRDAQRWQDSLAMRWAVVKLEKVEGEWVGRDPMEGVIREERKSVNELMREMRLNSGGNNISERGPPPPPPSQKIMSATWGSRSTNTRNENRDHQQNTQTRSRLERSTNSFDRGSMSEEGNFENHSKETPEDTWSLVSTGPIDKTYTMVHEIKDEET
ncbi:MAG: hypothetical protein M1812_000126 [Candelaria pacifica]|nr:MAG: hypothetical protein M1812_000126 [Candelaria pacifica]